MLEGLRSHFANHLRTLFIVSLQSENESTSIALFKAFLAYIIYIFNVA